MNSVIQPDYLNSRTNHLDQTIKHTSSLCFKRFPVQKALVYCESCYRFSLTEAHILHYTFHESINILLQQRQQRSSSKPALERPNEDELYFQKHIRADGHLGVSLVCYQGFHSLLLGQVVDPAELYNITIQTLMITLMEGRKRYRYYTEECHYLTFNDIDQIRTVHWF